MEEKERIILDFTNCRYLSDIYLELRSKTEWKDWYGESLDALWDILTGLPYEGIEFIIKRPRRYTDIPNGDNANFGEYLDKVYSIFKRAETMYGEITAELEYADESSIVNDDYKI